MAQPLILIHTNYSLFSNQQKDLADFILQNKSQAAEMGIEQLANQCGISKATVLRFIKKIGYDSYRIFHMDINKEMAICENERDSGAFPIDYMDISDDTNQMIVQKVTSQLSVLIQDMPNILDYHTLDKAVKLISKARNIFFFAVGGTSSLALDAYHKFMRLGIMAFYETNNHLALIRSSHLSSNDVLFIISRTGESREDVECAITAKRNGCKIITLSSFNDSSLAKISDVLLLCSFTDSKWDTDYMVTRAMLLVILDILYLCVRRDLKPKSVDALQISSQVLLQTKVNPNRKKNLAL